MAIALLDEFRSANRTPDFCGKKPSSDISTLDSDSDSESDLASRDTKVGVFRKIRVYFDLKSVSYR